MCMWTGVLSILKEHRQMSAQKPSPEIAVQMPRAPTGSPSSLGSPPAWGHSVMAFPLLLTVMQWFALQGPQDVLKHEPTSTEEMLERQALSLSP